jgi:hypothetical protein
MAPLSDEAQSSKIASNQQMLMLCKRECAAENRFQRCKSAKSGKPLQHATAQRKDASSQAVLCHIKLPLIIESG